MLKSKEIEGDKLMKKASNFCKASVMEMRFKADWNQAAPLYEQAATAYRNGQCLAKARIAFEKAAEAQQQLGSSWHAGKMLEKAAESAKTENGLEFVEALYIQASEAYLEAGRPQTGSGALMKGAKALEKSRPDRASLLYTQAITVLEQDERFSFGPELFRAAIGHEINKECFDEAVALLLKFASVCSERNLHMSVCNAYLGAIVVSLYSQNAKEANAIFTDSSSIDTFCKSEEYKAADALLKAYQTGLADEVKSVIKSHTCFQYLDTVIGRLALKLPLGDLQSLAKAIQLPHTEQVEEEVEEDLT